VPRDRAAASLIDILHYKGIANLDQKELIHALTLFSQRNNDIVDCILCVKATCHGMSLFSFDDDLNKMNDAISSLETALRQAVILKEKGLPSIGVILDILDEDAFNFYNHFNTFHAFSDNPMRLFVPMQAIQQL